MTNGSPASFWCFATLPLVALRQPLWHVYRHTLDDGKVIGPTQFNPYSKGRLALPDRSMYYAATTAECVLWEVPPLRSVMGDPKRRVALHVSQFARLRLTQVQPARTLQLIDLQGPSLRQLACNEPTFNALHAAVQTQDHASTYSLAAALLDEAQIQALPVDGLLWRSKQLNTDADRVVLLYDPPVDARDLGSIGEDAALDDGEDGWMPIDKALKRCGYQRLTADPGLSEEA